MEVSTSKAALWDAKSWQAGQRGPAQPKMIAKLCFSLVFDYMFLKVIKNLMFWDVGLNKVSKTLCF